MKKQLKLQFIFIFCAVLILATGVKLLLLPNTSYALSGSSFQAGRIIDDGVFFSGQTMSTPEIQAFLNSKVPACDTWGAQSYNNTGMTRAQWTAANGKPQPPYYCLRDAFFNGVPGKAADSYCGAISSGNKSAAQIIKDVSLACSINPQVLLVLLQKEQSLITDDWPWPRQYEAATGYGCPDTAPCDPEFAGFFNQVYYAGRQFQRYAKQAQIFNFRAGSISKILYNPNTGCGDSNVYIQNQATSGLYNYTPYQPNQAALNNLYGAGDSCSAYGNRNFWRMFIDWFGAPYSNCTYPNTPDATFRAFNPNTNGVFLTSDPNEICAATGNMGYIYDGPLFYTPGAGTEGVYRLQKNGSYFYTISPTERDSAINTYGYRLEGVAFTASSTATAGAPVAIYRLSYPPTGRYFYTTSTAEVDDLVANMGFRNEGVAFYTQNTTGSVYPNDVYRVAHSGAGYLLTASSSEKDNAILSYGFRDEGVGFQTRVGYSTDSLPVYRLNGAHGYLLTTSLGERKAALSMGYRPEGIAFFAYPQTNLGATKPIYRLRNSVSTYLYTTSTTERDSAIQSYGYTLEGVAFRVP
jgi:hypothetical protein